MQEKMDLYNFHSQLQEELNKLFEKVTKQESSQFINLLNLSRYLNSNSIDIVFYIENIEILDQFLNLVKEYNIDQHKEILNNLDKQAKIITILIRDISNRKLSDDPLVRLKKYSDKGEISELEKTLVNLRSNINIIKEEQQNIIELNSEILSSQQNAVRIVEELKSKNDAYSQLIDEDSNARIRKLYDEIYDQEIELANKYREWALWIFVGVGIVILISIFLVTIQNGLALWSTEYSKIEFSWGSLVKSLMLISLTTPAWYLTRESSQHRKVAYKAKMLGTELASFPLYVREFKDEDRFELRKNLADRFFGQELYNDSSNAKNSNDVSIEQVKLIAEANKVLAESLKVKQNLS